MGDGRGNSLTLSPQVSANVRFAFKAPSPEYILQSVLKIVFLLKFNYNCFLVFPLETFQNVKIWCIWK